MAALGKPQLCKTLCKFQSASKHELPVRGSFEAIASYRNCTTRLIFMVTEVLGLNPLGRDAIKALGITDDNFFFSTAKAISSAEIDRDLPSACSKLCDDYADPVQTGVWLFTRRGVGNRVQIRIQTNLHEIPPYSVCHTR